jgi:multimeric flavodoxin WrbA
MTPRPPAQKDGHGHPGVTWRQEYITVGAPGPPQRMISPLGHGTVAMPLRLVALHGSARRRGNSRALLDEVLAGAREASPAGLEVEVVEAYRVDVGPCTACGACEKPGGGEEVEGCAVRTDDWPRIEALLRGADALVLASPVYFMGLPAPLKAIVDRLQAVWWLSERGGRVPTNRGPFRRAAVVLVASGDRAMFKGARAEALAALHTLEFEVVGELLAEGLEEDGEAAGRPELLGQARAMGRVLVEGLPSGPASTSRPRRRSRRG